MTLDVYQELFRYSNAIMAFFFLYQGGNGLIIYTNFRQTEALWHFFMCSLAGLHCALLVFSSFVPGSWMNEIFWVTGSLAYFAYLNIIRRYCGIEHFGFRLIQWYFLLAAAVSIVATLERLVLAREPSLMFVTDPLVPTSLIQQTLHAYSRPTQFGVVLGASSFLITCGVSLYILYRLYRLRPRDVFLMLGVICTLISSVNDMLLSLHVLTSSITLFFLGYLFESARFVYIFERDAALQTEKIRRAKNRAEAASKAKSQFLSHMSHELRTPLNAVVGFSQLLELDEGLTADQHAQIEEIHKAGNHLLSLINDVLDLSRIEAGVENLSIRSVEVAPLIGDCLPLCRSMANQRGVVLRSSVPPDARMLADHVRLKQVLLNLLSNAIKYNREKGSVDIVAAATGDNRVRISVIDTGPGIKPDKLKRLFTPFDRLDAETTDIQGSGIGLSLTRKLVELMNGRIGVDSIEDQGSTFWVEFAVPTDSP